MTAPARAVVFDPVAAVPAVRELEVAEPAPTEVLVRVTASGLCHTDRHVVTGGLAQSAPVVLGHEGAGVVERVGSAVTRLRPGQTVVMLSVPSCGVCWFCVRAEGHSCQDMDVMRSVPHFTTPDGAPLAGFAGLGTFSDRITVDQTAVVGVTADLPSEQLALVSCAVVTGVGAVLASPVSAGSAVVVVGCGAVGLAAIQAARLAGAGEIVAVDIEPAKREAARRCGATVTVDPAEADPGDLARRRTEGRGADVAFEAVGSADAIRQAVRATRRGGVTVAMGLARPSELLDLSAAELVTGRKTLVGSIYGGSDPRRLVPTIVDLAQREKLDLAPLVSHRIAIGDVPAALTVDGDGAVVRTVVTFGGS